MRIPLRLLLIRLVALVAVGFSSALLVDYARPTPAFCSINSGCDDIINLGHGHVLGVPVPALGVVAFLALIVVSLFPARPLGRLLAPMAVVGGATGLALILVQTLVINAVCWMCMVVDSLALVIALLAFALRPRGGATEPDVSPRWIWYMLMVFAIILPILGGFAVPRPRVPKQIEDLYVAGKINVVEITDFECPVCRRIHPVIEEVVEEFGDQVHFLRVITPLRHHANARFAAAAYHCAAAQNKREEMAELLYHAHDLSPKSCEKLAASLGVSIPEYQSCVASNATEKQIDSDMTVLRKAHVRAVPTIFIQDRVLSGSQPKETLRSAIQKAARQLEEERRAAGGRRPQQHLSRLEP